MAVYTMPTAFVRATLSPSSHCHTYFHPAPTPTPTSTAPIPLQRATPIQRVEQQHQADQQQHQARVKWTADEEARVLAKLQLLLPNIPTHSQSLGIFASLQIVPARSLFRALLSSLFQTRAQTHRNALIDKPIEVPAKAFRESKWGEWIKWRKVFEFFLAVRKHASIV